MVSKTLALFGEISDPEKVIFSFSTNATVNNILRAFFPLLEYQRQGYWKSNRTADGLGFMLLPSLYGHISTEARHPQRAGGVIPAGQWDIGSWLHNGCRRTDVSDSITVIDVATRFKCDLSFHPSV